MRCCSFDTDALRTVVPGAGVQHAKNVDAEFVLNKVTTQRRIPHEHAVDVDVAERGAHVAIKTHYSNVRLGQVGACGF